ncbi:hypothetical protein LTR86_001069 [Recurvomyces mirabilis]|nr:hypothetical protein LTR86_001069 [Recurvomyces mirabilis]
MLLSFLTFGLGFASINAEEIPQGIMPKRQVVGTGVTTSTSTGPPSTSTTAISTTSSTVISDSSTTSPTSQTSQTTPTSSPTSSVISDSTTSTPTSSQSQSASPTSSNGPSSSQSSVVQSSTEVSTTIPVTTTNRDGSTITSNVATHTLAPASTPSSSFAISTETGSASSLVVIGSSTFNRATISHKTTITSALVALETLPSTYTSYWTSDGSVYSKLVTTNAVITSTTGFATATLTPSLQNGGGSGGNLSTSSKQIVGGVVGGIGGAILIGGIALVAWRLWGKKKRQAVPQDDFMDSRDDSIRQEKRESHGVPYNNPNGAVNTASNF